MTEVWSSRSVSGTLDVVSLTGRSAEVGKLGVNIGELSAGGTRRTERPGRSLRAPRRRLARCPAGRQPR